MSFKDGDLLGDPDPTHSLNRDLFTISSGAPGRCVDLSGASSLNAPAFGVSGSSASASCVRTGGGSNGGYSSGGQHFADGRLGGGNTVGNQNSSRGPTSIEGGGGGVALSLNGLSPANIIRMLQSRPVTDLVMDHSRHLLNIPRYAAHAYSSAARKYLRPWNEFLRIRPGRVAHAFRDAQRRGEIQIFVQRNVLANARNFCPNYIFLFLATLFWMVCTSPALLCMLGTVGGGWTHALRSEGFRNRPWQLQVGSVSVPLGSNIKMAIMALPTLVFLHFFMGPLLWSAALCTSIPSLAHAALRDRDDDADDHGLGRDDGSIPRV